MKLRIFSNKNCLNFFQINEGSVSILWEAHKAFLRGECISVGSRLKRDAVKLKAELISQLRAAETILLRSPTVERLRVVASFWNRFNSLDLNKISISLWSREVL